MNASARMTRGMAEAADAAPSNDTVDLLALFHMLWRRKLMMAIVIALGTVGAYAFGKLLTPYYTASAAVLIDPQQVQLLDLKAVLSGDITTEGSSLATQMKLMQSRNFLARVMDELNLFQDPEFNLALQPPGQIQVSLSQPFRKLIALIPLEWQTTLGLNKPPAPILESDAARITRESTIDVFSKNLEVTTDGSYVLTISFASLDSVKAARIANRIAQVYVDDQLKSKLLTTDRASTWLNERLATLKEELRIADEAVERYKADNNLVSTQSGGLLNDQELVAINTQLSQAKADLAERQAKLALVRGLKGHGQSVDAIQEVMSSPVIINLRAQETELLRQEANDASLYGPRHPKMLELQVEKANIEGKIDAEVARITTVLQNDVSVAATRLATIQAQLDSYTNRTNENREAGIKLQELQRQADSTRALYQAFMTRSKEVGEQQEVAEPDAKLVGIATPPNKPSTPGAILFAAAGFLASGMLAGLLALLLDRLDRGLRSAREVETALGLPTLALVPKLDKLKRGQRPYQYLMDKPLSAYTEAVRGIYMALKLSNIDRAPKVILVTSALPEEGKTTIAVSLATFAARSHKRVLLIDLDVRHPSVHQELGWSVSHGLVEYLVDDRPLEDVIQHDLESGLHFIPVKAQATNPTDLLESERLRSLIELCRSRYDYVIIDSAPLVSVTDSRLVALLADKTVFVIKWGDTVESAAQDAVQTLRDIGVDIAGAVLTQIDLKKHAQYHYADIGEYYNKTKNYYVN
jgi:succinoglycan biosynthesis transport protein ExoP